MSVSKLKYLLPIALLCCDTFVKNDTRQYNIYVSGFSEEHSKIIRRSFNDWTIATDGEVFFTEAELKEPDTVVYEIKKFFNLASACNPSIIEVLHTDPSDHIIVSDIGRIILDHKDKFLSKRVRYTFSGYAVSQLKRINLL